MVLTATSNSLYESQGISISKSVYLLRDGRRAGRNQDEDNHHHPTSLVTLMGLFPLLDSVRSGKERCGGDDLGVVNVSATTVMTHDVYITACTAGPITVV